MISFIKVCFFSAREGRGQFLKNPVLEENVKNSSQSFLYGTYIHGFYVPGYMTHIIEVFIKSNYHIMMIIFNGKSVATLKNERCKTSYESL